MEKLVRKALEIQTSGKGHVFVNYSGHVEAIHVMVHIGGWVIGNDADIDEIIYLDKLFDKTKYRSLMKRLDDVLKGN